MEQSPGSPGECQTRGVHPRGRPAPSPGDTRSRVAGIFPVTALEMAIAPYGRAFAIGGRVRCRFNLIQDGKTMKRSLLTIAMVLTAGLAASPAAVSPKAPAFALQFSPP